MIRKFIIKTPEIRANAVNAVKHIRGEDNLEVIIRPHKDDQTAEQRGFFHVLVGLIAGELGYSPGDMKQVIKAECWGTHPVTVRGITVEVIKSSAKADKDEYSRLIETAYRVAAECGIELPNPRWNDE